jgi:hypothetical protein
MGKKAHKWSDTMKYAAIAAIFCIGLLAWYNTPNPSPPVESQAPVERESTNAAAGPQHLAAAGHDCTEFLHTVEWRQLKATYAGMSDTALCDFVHAPDIAKLEGINVNPRPAEDLLSRLLNQHDDENSHLADVPDLRYYLDPQAVAALRGLTATQLIDKINTERSAEAAFLLAQKYHEDEQTYVMLMLSAASYAQKPGPLLNANNGCCSWTPGDAEGERAAAIKREALTMIAREMNLPEAGQWREYDLDPELEAAVLEQHAAYVQELNQYSMEAFGEEWIQ